MFDRLVFWLVNSFTYMRHPLNIARFRSTVGYFPNVARPKRYNEKMLWRKIFDHNPLFVAFSDKLATKALQADRCRELRILPVLWVGSSASTIPQDLLSKPVAVKANHGCGYSFFSRPGAAATQLPVNQINGWLKKSYGRGRLEWAYQFAERKIYVEELIIASQDRPLIDISVHASDRTPLFIEAIVGNKTENQQKAYFKPDGTRLWELEKKPAAGNHNPPLPADFQLPATYVEALNHTRRLSLGVDYARFDFLSTADRLYAGEITVYPGSGLTKHVEFSTYNKYLAERWDLSKSWFLSSRHGRIRQIYADALHRHLKQKQELG